MVKNMKEVNRWKQANKAQWKALKFSLISKHEKDSPAQIEFGWKKKKKLNLNVCVNEIIGFYGFDVWNELKRWMVKN